MATPAPDHRGGLSPDSEGATTTGPDRLPHNNLAAGHGGSPPSGRRPRAGAAPSEHARLLKLTVVSGVLYLLFGAVVTTMFATMDVAAVYERMGAPAEQAQQAGAMFEQMQGASIASGAVGLLGLVGLYGLIYVFLKKGANWARILGIVLAILSSLAFLGNAFGFWLYGQWAIALIAIGIAFIAVNIAWLVTAFKAPVRAWFTQQH